MAERELHLAQAKQLNNEVWDILDAGALQQRHEPTPSRPASTTTRIERLSRANSLGRHGLDSPEVRYAAAD